MARNRNQAIVEDEGALREAEIEETAETPAVTNETASAASGLDELTQLRADAERLKNDYLSACALVAQMHAAAVGEGVSPKRGVVQDVEDVINALRSRVAELEDLRQTGEAGNCGSVGEKDQVEKSYELFCQGQSEGEFPAWEVLPIATQQLWRDSYKHVADGGKPRTDYEHAVKYLIVSAQ